MGRLRLMFVTVLAASALTLQAVPIGATEAVVSEADRSTFTRAVHFVVDVSGSMAGTPLTQAKSALTAGVGGLEPDRGAGLRSFGGGCSSGGNLLVPVGVDNRSALEQRIAGLTAGGGTPTPAALRAAASDFPDGLDERVIVLISDGMSTCGDPCPVAAQLAADADIAFTAHTVGFNAPESAAAELTCIAEVTGGTYVYADDEPGLIDAIGGAIGGTAPSYVAIGDSTTTGFSIPTCDGDRAASEFGCTGTPPAPPYPERVAAARADLNPLARKGIWGDTITRTVAAYHSGRNADDELWEPQLRTAQRATDLVTVSLGANDMGWSDVWAYASNCVSAPTRSIFGVEVFSGPPRLDTDDCASFVAEKFAVFEDELDELLDLLQPRAAAGAEVAVLLYYNPFNDTRYVARPWPLPDGERTCSLLPALTDVMLSKLNTELADRAHARGFSTVDLGPAFVGHGAGSQDPYVFGSDCEWRGLASAPRVGIDLRQRRADVRDPSIDEIAKRFDPHPNAAGTRAQADAVLEVIR
jgi:lysophospholipase L1-like esterase